MPSRNCSHRSPPRRVLRGPVGLDQLWSLLTDAQRQQTLVTLSGIVARQVDAPLDEQEVSMSSRKRHVVGRHCHRPRESAANSTPLDCGRHRRFTTCISIGWRSCTCDNHRRSK